MKNILDNPNNEKYYRIKTDSQHFKNFIESNHHSLALFELFGFSKKQIDDTEYYCMPMGTSISYIRGLSLDFTNVSNKYLN